MRRASLTAISVFLLAGAPSLTRAQAPNPVEHVGLRVVVPGEGPVELWVAPGDPARIRTENLLVTITPQMTGTGITVEIRTERSVDGRMAEPASRIHLTKGRAERTRHGWWVGFIGTRRFPNAT